MENISEYLEKAISYPEYIELGKKLLSQNQTSGMDQSAEMVEYARLNDHRVDRILKKGVVLPESKARLESINEPAYLLVISEYWCGDAAQNIPWIHLMVKDHPTLQLRIVFRDENPDLMNQFLTNGSQSIPKVILLNANKEVCGTWGPRPESAQHLIMENKKTGALPKDELYKKLHLWYAQNEGKEIQSEFFSLLERCTKSYI